jgi:hypothetical protein
MYTLSLGEELHTTGSILAADGAEGVAEGVPEYREAPVKGSAYDCD